MTNDFSKRLDTVSYREVRHMHGCVLSLLISHICLTANALLLLSMLQIIIVI